MAAATNKVTGVTVTADEAVIRLLGPEWAPVASSVEKASPRRSSRSKRDKK